MSQEGYDMIGDDNWFETLRPLEELAMGYEVAVFPLFAQDYLQEFYDWFRIRDRDRRAKLIPSEEGFEASLKAVSGEYRWEAIAEMAKRLYGLPSRVMVFDDDRRLRDALGGPRGLSSFFFVFDMMFCEYGDFTLCFLSGTNN